MADEPAVEAWKCKACGEMTTGKSSCTKCGMPRDWGKNKY